MTKSTQQQEVFWRNQYNYCVRLLTDARAGKDVPVSIQCLQMGPEASIKKEVNYAREKLQELGVERIELK